MKILRTPPEIILHGFFRDSLRSHQPRVHAAVKLFLQAFVHLFVHRADDEVTQTQPVLHVIYPVPREIQVVMVCPRDNDRVIARDFLYVFDGQSRGQSRLRDWFGFARVRETEVDVFE